MIMITKIKFGDVPVASLTSVNVNGMIARVKLAAITIKISIPSCILQDIFKSYSTHKIIR
uniref:Uncharacterized protein n=1 Tax=Onchocerca volvulus TaxID=6282 RepID=A0A8R1TW59_ONCVO